MVEESRCCEKKFRPSAFSSGKREKYLTHFLFSSCALHRVDKIDDFYLKNQKIGFFLFISDFFDLNQIFLIFLNKKKSDEEKGKKLVILGWVNISL